MLRGFFRAALLILVSLAGWGAEPGRIVIIKLDGVPADVVQRYVERTDRQTGRSYLPWIKHVFADDGAWVRNFYVRGISLSAPSWAMLDTGRHTPIHGNAEYDRYAPRVYDYLNFFPFYVNYARSRTVDMPGVEVLDEAGIPLLCDSFPHDRRFQSMQLFQRGVRWGTLQRSLQNRFFRSPRALLNEWQTGFEMSRGVAEQVERELIDALGRTDVLYLDYFSGEYDHVAHLTGDDESQYAVLKRLDAYVGRLWNAIGASPLASRTLLVMVSDHGMTTDPATYSQSYDLVRFFGSAEGGGHHVLTNRHPMQMFKLRGLDPFVSEVITASSDSIYLRGQAQAYPTAQLDLDGNERAGVQLRNSDLNALQILFTNGSPEARREAAAIIDEHREAWATTAREIGEELDALGRAIDRLRPRVSALPRKWTKPDQKSGAADAGRRLRTTLEEWERDRRSYGAYAAALKALLGWRVDAAVPVVPPRVMGEPNSVEQLRNYVVGPGRRVNYLATLTALRVRNNVQANVSAKPVDFVAVADGTAPLRSRLVGGTGDRAGGGAGDGAADRARDGAGDDTGREGAAGPTILLYGGEGSELRIQSRTDADGTVRLRAVPVAGEWRPGLPLALIEDGLLPDWLGEWHTDREWLLATHRLRYSNAVVGLYEHFRPWAPDRLSTILAENSDAADADVLRRFEQRKRAAVSNDMLLLASKFWNFNVRNPNAGGNHGSFFRTATHSVLMFAGAGVPKGLRIEQPYDSLSFIPTVLRLSGRSAEGYPGRAIEELVP